MFFQLCLYLTVVSSRVVADCHFDPNAPKHHFWVSHDQNLQIAHNQNLQTLHIWDVQNAHYGGKKCQNVEKNVFAPNAPKTHLGVSDDQNLQNLHIWGVCVSKMPIVGVKKVRFAKTIVWLQMPP